MSARDQTLLTENDLPPVTGSEEGPTKTSSSRKGMVATAHWEATRAGVYALEEGGNAIDAAVASAFALGVCEPAASGLGGQTLMLIRFAQEAKTIALDGSSRAPNRAVPKSLSSTDRRAGYQAATVPSTPAALAYAAQRYGTLPIETLLEPAIALAEGGYRVSELQHLLTSREAEGLANGTAGAIFLPMGKAPEPGSLFKQPALASTLKEIASGGAKAFYQDKISHLIEEDMVRHGGLIRRDDLAQIPWPLERKPVSTLFEGMRVRTFPPPGAGRTLIEMLNVLTHFEPEERDPDTPGGAVLLAKLIRRAFRDRRDRPFDPNVYPQVQSRRMMSKDYASDLAEELSVDSDEMRGETTHLSTMDASGNAVALTQSIERVFGSYSATEELGFIYNNYMMAFEHKKMRHPYFMRPNAVPWASVAPTIIFRHKGRRPLISIGSPGSERITPSIVQVLLRLGKSDPLEAVSAPRLFCSPKGKVSIEARASDDVIEALQKAGFEIDLREPYSFYLGCVQAVIRSEKVLTGVADPRRDGSAVGLPNR